jgi:hypothetical protein
MGTGRYLLRLAVARKEQLTPCCVPSSSSACLIWRLKVLDLKNGSRNLLIFFWIKPRTQRGSKSLLVLRLGRLFFFQGFYGASLLAASFQPSLKQSFLTGSYHRLNTVVGELEGGR